MSSTTKKKAPITRHPAFPVTVALWFAALFGMGSLLLHPALLESLVLAIRLDRLIPAAAPPLGFTARTLVACLLATAGGLAGLALGRALGRAPMATRREAVVQPVERAGTADRPIPGEKVAADPADPHHADDNDDLARLEAARESAPVRRRGLNAQLVADPFALPANPEPTILNLGDLTAIEPIGAADSSEVLGTPVTILPPEPVSEPEPAAVAAAPEAEQAPTAPAPQPGHLPFRRREGSAAEVLRQAPLDTLGVVELVERFALALDERRLREAASGPVPTEAPALTIGVPAATTEAAVRPFDMPVAPPALIFPANSNDWLNGALPPATQFEPETNPGAADFEDEREAGHLRGLDEGGWALPELDDEPDEALAPDAPLDKAAEADPAAVASDTADELAFSSLLAMKPAARPAAALQLDREDDPRPAGARPEATEEALRKALAALQRMSGAA